MVLTVKHLHRTLWTALFAALAAPASGQQAPPAPPAPGWIGFFVGVEQERPSDEPVVVVLAVADGSPAARAGLAEGDTLLAVDGIPLTPERLRTLQAGLRSGDQVALTMRRSGSARVLRVRADPRPAAAAAPDPFEIRMESARRLMQGEPTGGIGPTPVVQQWVFVQPAEGLHPTPMPEPGSEMPFTVHVFGDARADSLLAALKLGQKQLLQARSTESARVRELAARTAPGSRIDGSDRSLLELRRRRELLTTEVALLDAALHTLVAGRAAGPMIVSPSGQAWTVSVAPPAAPAPQAAPAAPVAMTPYIAGRDRVAGAKLSPMNEGLAGYFGTSNGLVVIEVAEGTPADEAGLRSGDVVLRVGGVDVNDLEGLRRAIGGSLPLAVVVLRRGSLVQLVLPR